jgi:glycosyltransferase involved in cell wall biosynthesis
LIRTYWRLLKKHRWIEDYDVMVLGYPGQLDVTLARLLTWLRHRPLVLDVFMSLYLIASERGLTERHPVTARLLYGVEKMACSLPERLVIDTAAYVAWFQDTYGVSPDRFRLVPTGADDRVFGPVDGLHAERDPFRVIYYGTFIPNHGVEHIVEAARLLAGDTGVHFELVGEGPERERVCSLAKRYELSNVTFTPWLEREELLLHVADADVCLGAFGLTPQSLMTVQNKIYEGLAMGKPVITGDADTVRAALVHGEHVYLVERANPGALAEGILALRSDPALRRRLGEQGRRLFLAQYSTQQLGRRMRSHLEELLAVSPRRVKSECG